METWAFADRIGRRRVLPCPSCHVLLRWSAFWYRAGLAALWLIIAAIVPLEVGLLPRPVQRLFSVVATIVFFVSLLLRRLERPHGA